LIIVSLLFRGRIPNARAAYIGLRKVGYWVWSYQMAGENSSFWIPGCFPESRSSDWRRRLRQLHHSRRSGGGPEWNWTTDTAIVSVRKFLRWATASICTCWLIGQSHLLLPTTKNARIRIGLFTPCLPKTYLRPTHWSWNHGEAYQAGRWCCSTWGWTSY